jgi:hypothetical protein
MPRKQFKIYLTKEGKALVKKGQTPTQLEEALRPKLIMGKLAQGMDSSEN